ncbi:hypothetical protein GCM10023232_24010 [Sphingosinicella ginsenosidimutans]|uniref:Uncharacterized protein n=1 Tax=Allosphingosinicella ginsenosidimutans TaxID=1176539 RepID=A0A5C6TUA6_9SPHN|nr:hypothetical protein [Sphingosinicella ginsenosidimutans]TXC63621.1 hypothetical protein FRZ32_08075 [Sphingosinicella ginsenosidimutans]
MAKVKIPKKIAGVKIPKKARKKAKKAIEAADNPFVRGLAAAALTGATRAARPEPRPEFSARLDIDGEAIVGAVRDAAREGLRAFLEGLEQGLREGRADESGDAPTAH